MNKKLDSEGVLKLSTLGYWFSLLCALHCIATPIILLALPVASLSFLRSDWAENSLLAGSVTLSFVNLYWGFRLHHKQPVFVLLAVSVTMILIGRFLTEEPLEIILVAGGLLLLAACQLWNRRLCKACRNCVSTFEEAEEPTTVASPRPFKSPSPGIESWPLGPNRHSQPSAEAVEAPVRQRIGK